MTDFVDLDKVEDLVPVEPSDEEEKTEISEGESLEDLFSRNKKLVYLIDISGSMSSAISDIEQAKAVYDWNPIIIDRLRRKIIERAINHSRDFLDITHHLKRGWQIVHGSYEELLKNKKTGKYVDPADLPEDFDDDDYEIELKEKVPPDLSTLDKESQEFLLGCEEIGMDMSDEDKLIAHIVDNDLFRQYNISVSTTESKIYKRKTKLQMVKEASKTFIEKKFKDHPDADVVIMPFNDLAEKLPRQKFTLEDLLVKISNLRTRGGTDIYKALKSAITFCMKVPSKVGVSHIVLITDAQDFSGKSLEDYLSEMQENSITLDFIRVTGVHDRTDKNIGGTASVLKNICKETGGEYIEISDASDFMHKFFEISKRKLLPPGI